MKWTPGADAMMAPRCMDPVWVIQIGLITHLTVSLMAIADCIVDRRTPYGEAMAMDLVWE